MAGSKRHAYSVFWLAALVASVPVRAAGQYGATAVVKRPIASVNQEDATASGTGIELTDRVAAGESVADAIVEAPGARPFRSGALGSFTSASIRGADYEHTAVLLGELPISRADASAFNLDTIPASMLERIVVYRGGAPVWLSQGEIGGLIQLIPKRAHASEVSGTASAGSFGLLEAGGDAAVMPSEKLVSVFSSAGIRSSKGDFKFLYDNNTSLDPSDDYVTRRRNADALDGHGLMYFRAPLGSGALDVVLTGFERLGGEPGSPANPAFQARRSYARYLGAASYQQSKESTEGYRLYRFQILGGASFEQTRFTDLYKEVGSFQSGTDDGAGDTYARAAGSLAVTRHIEFTLLGTARYEDFSHDDAFARVPLPPSSRTTVAGAAEINLHGSIADRRFELRPSVRYEQSRADLRAERFAGIAVTQVDSVTPTFRAAGVMEIAPGLAASASAATGKRVPSILELFGDGALLVGNPSLSQERSISFDAGLVAQGQLGPVSGSSEARVFSLSVDDRIIYVANSLHQLVPLNLRSSRIHGVEIGLTGNATRHFRLSAAATLMDTEGKPGKQLPNQAQAVAHLQPEVILGPYRSLDALSVFVETNFVSPTFDDPNNATLPKPSELFVNTGVALWFFQKSWELRFTVRDVFDRQGQDFRGFLLPGRTLIGTLTYRKEII